MPLVVYTSVRRLILAVTCLITLGAVWWILWVTLLEPTEKSTASGYGQFVVAVVVAVCSLAVWVVRTFWSRTAEPLDRLADRLAARMHERWTKEAHDRDLLVEPLPIRWHQAALSVAVPVAAATSTRGGRPRFDPLPGISVITSTTLQEGDRSTLYDVYGGLPSGRLVITGDAGSGKSAAAILLLLDALKFREKCHSGIPVPVMFTLHNWDPEATPVNEWLIHKLAETLPLRRDDAKRLVQESRIAVFLDGLDEMPEQLRPIALKALNKADFRLVLLSRRKEFGTVLWLTLGTGTSLFASNQDDNRAHDPVASWRQDAMAGLGFGVICGFGALTAGLCFGMRFNLGLPAVLAVGLLGGLAAMLALPPAITASWPTFCFQIELALRHRTPLRLMRFLEDARERGVLRTVGPIYQFRHAELQDRLAANVSKPE